MKESNGQLEENIINVLEQLEEEGQQQTDIQARIQELQAQLTQETTNVESQIATLEEDSLVERKKRDQLAADLDVSLCVRYERISAIVVVWPWWKCVTVYAKAVI